MIGWSFFCVRYSVQRLSHAAFDELLCLLQGSLSVALVHWRARSRSPSKNCCCASHMEGFCCIVHEAVLQRAGSLVRSLIWS